MPRHVLGAGSFATVLLALAGTARAQEDVVALGPDSRIVVREIAEGDSALGWTVAARVPAIEGPAASDRGWIAFASSADSIVRAEIRAFRENLEGWDASQEFPGWSSFDADGSVAWAEPPLLSWIVDVSVYYAGAAHPGHYTVTLVWDAERGRALAPEDLFRAGADWPAALSRVAIPLLERELGEMADPAWVAEGAGPSAENFARWALVPDGLLLLFDPYQVAPYAAGPQAVTIPRTSLADVADPSGPLAPLAPR